MNKIFVAYTTLNSIMSNRSKTYRFFSALTLILFFSSVVLPSGIAAAGLLCDMDVAEMHDTSQACCDMHDAQKAEHHQTEAAKEHCQDDQICPHIISSNQTEVQATVTHQVKDVVALTVIGEIQRSLIDHSELQAFEPSLAVPHHSPPLFLLNSVFLN